jgi:hypothetical protein
MLEHGSRRPGYPYVCSCQILIGLGKDEDEAQSNRNDDLVR